MLEEMLKKYLEKKSELAFRKIDIEEIEQRISYHNLVYVEAVNECIEGEALPAPTLSHIPRSETNKFHSKTENVAENYDPVHMNKVDILQLRIDKANMERQIEPLRREVETVERLLIALNDKERYVIEMYYFRQYRINEIVNMFAAKFGYGSKTNVWNTKEEAYAKMERIYNRKTA